VPPKVDLLDEVAQLLRQGMKYELIAEELGLTKRKVYVRVQALRRALAQRDNNVAWLTAANPVEVGRGWVREPLWNTNLRVMEILVKLPPSS